MNCSEIMKLILSFFITPIILGIIIAIPMWISHLLDKLVDKKDRKKTLENSYKAYLSNENNYRIWHPKGSIVCKLAFPADKTQRVVDMPRLTFERWLTFYNLNPENWIIQTDTDVYSSFYSSLYSDIPYYAKLDEDKKWIVLPIFWSSPEEMGKFRDWLENVYQCGEARIHQQKQEENYKKLVEIVENDIKERQDKVQQDLLNMRKELLNIKKEETIPTEEEAEIILGLPDGTTYKVNKQDYEWYKAHTPNGYIFYKDGKIVNANSCLVIKK